MTGPDTLTGADLNALGAEAFDADDPLAVAAQLVAAGEQGRLADLADTGHAYGLAAEIHEEYGDLAEALALADRSVAAYQSSDADAAWARAARAGLLFRLDRADEAMADLGALRPRLVTDDLVVLCVAETLELADRADTAVEWLTGALDELRERHPEGLPEEQTLAAYELAVVRHRLRRDLQLPYDDYDVLADEFLAAAEQGDREEGGPDLPGAVESEVMLWWPQPEYEQVVARWPEAAASVAGQSWDEQRRVRQMLITAWHERGLPALWQVTGTAEDFATYLAAYERDAGEGALDAYAAYLSDQGRAVRLPPGRNERCWCGSGGKYKKCCLPLART